jgi:hypothetical protein
VIRLALEEVLIKSNTGNGHKNGRNTNKAAEEEQRHIFRVETLNKGDKKSGKSSEENYDVVHDYIIVRFCAICESYSEIQILFILLHSATLTLWVLLF